MDRRKQKKIAGTLKAFSTRLTKSTKNGATDNEADNNKKMLEALEKLVTAMPNEDAAPSEAN